MPTPPIPIEPGQIVVDAPATGSWQGGWLSLSAAWGASATAHAVLLVLAGLMFVALPTHRRDDASQLVAAIDQSEPLPDLEAIEPALITLEHDPLAAVDAPPSLELDSPTVDAVADELPSGADAASPPLVAVDSSELARLNPTLSLRGEGAGQSDTAGSGKGFDGAGEGLGGRGKARGAALERGASHHSERAVDLALQWLAAHQLADGSWNFDHRGGQCQGRCRHPGKAARARAGATGMALLPFLGAGHTHLEGRYRETVARGIYFLLQEMKTRGSLASFTDRDGNLYSQGLATLALCEAWAMTRPKLPHKPPSDQPVSPGQVRLRGAEQNPTPPAAHPLQLPAEELARPALVAGQAVFTQRDLAVAAQMAVNYIVDAQGPDGGWRYSPRQRGDTSVVGWQLMALKSGHLGGLEIDPRTVARTYQFLDLVQAESGSHYNYTATNRGTIATRAIGLLCRMFLGWQRQNPALARGVATVARLGPSPSDLYYNYYATQVMLHTGGEAWQTWNEQMRDRLVKSQATAGHERGSWMVADPHGGVVGGRLYATCLSALTLEVYYRVLPLYDAATLDGPLPGR